VVTDLASRNGTYVAGTTDRARGLGPRPGGDLAPAGRVAIATPDVGRFLGARVERAGDAVVGPTLAGAWRRIELAARTGEHLLVTGESGTGKELAVRAFHAATGASGELVSVNCAAISRRGRRAPVCSAPRRGAYSGADHDADGYLVAADRGTLFLDEVGELEPMVQAKLLRALESREVLPLGAAKPRRIELRVVAATLRDLRDEVAERRFRDDLYHRIGRPEVHLAPLRERLEDIPWLAAHTAERAAPGLPLSARADRDLPAPAVAGQRARADRRDPPRRARSPRRRRRRARRGRRRADRRPADRAPRAGLAPRLGPWPARSRRAARPGPRPACNRSPIATPSLRALAAEGGNVVRTARAPRPPP